jgi:hypothetical protein
MRIVPSLIASLLLHSWLFFEAAPTRQTHAASDRMPLMVWVETRAEPAKVLAPEPAPEVAKSVAPVNVKPERRMRPRVQARSPATDGDGTLPVPQGDEENTSAGADADADGEGDGNTAAGNDTPAPHPSRVRQPHPAQLALWLDIAQLQQLALVRPTTAFLVAVPGYSEMLLGANLRPFSDLTRLSVRIAGRSAATLTLAGVHTAGEDALRLAAERVAAMRRQRPVWRGNSALRATSWVDGSRVDRGLAIHDGAFVIAPRASMPALLGERDPSARVSELSKLRARVVLAATLENVGDYIKELDGCGLSALHVSIATLADDYRLALTASYTDDRCAADARACASKHAAEKSRLLSGWLADAKATAGEYTTSLHTRVTHAEIEQLLDELGWGLRRMQRW